MVAHNKEGAQQFFLAIMTHSDIDSPTYLRFLRPHRRALARLRLDLEFYLEEVGPLIVVSVEDRLKSLESATKKAERFRLPVRELDDLAGLRVVAGTSVDIASLRHFFTNGLPGTSFEILKDRRVSKGSGYRAHHIVLQTLPEYTGSWERCKVEVQLQTALESAFNRISRLWIYKAERPLRSDWKTRFTQLADQLENLDSQAAALQRELLTDKVSLLDGDPLTPLAYQAILDECFAESTELDNAVWHCLFYRRSAIETCGELRNFFHRADIAAFYDECQTTMSSEERSSLLLFSSKGEFWATWGTRLTGARKLLELHRAKKRKGAT